MTALELTKSLKSLGKDFYNLADLEKVTGLGRYSLYVALSRWTAHGVLERLGRGLYAAAGGAPRLEIIAMHLHPPCYVSFESALSMHGVLEMIPHALTLATVRKSKKLEVRGRSLEFRQIKNNLFTGFELRDGFHLAFPEKALLDLIYLASMGKAALPETDLDLTKIPRKTAREFARRYPERVARKLDALLG